MHVREPGSLSRANGAWLVVDHFLRGWRLMKKKKVGEKLDAVVFSCLFNDLFNKSALLSRRESNFIQLMTSDRKLKASRHGSKRRKYGPYRGISQETPPS